MKTTFKIKKQLKDFYRKNKKSTRGFIKKKEGFPNDDPVDIFYFTSEGNPEFQEPIFTFLNEDQEKEFEHQVQKANEGLGSLSYYRSEYSF